MTCPVIDERHRTLLSMQLAREGDRREGLCFRQGKGWFQLPGSGHEGLAAIAEHLHPDDFIFPHYRDRALLLALGLSNYEIALSFLAKADSSSGGRQMASHFSSRSHNIVSLASPTGLQCLPAAGAAWACQRAGRSQLAVCCLGDATLRQGEFYEAYAFALEHSLPLVFVIEDNGYGISTPTARMNPLRLGIFGEQKPISGRDPDVIEQGAEVAVKRARSGLGPSLLWIEFDRLGSHTSSDDHRVYRGCDDIAAMTKRDYLGIRATPSLVQAVADDYDAAEAAPDPDPALAAEHTFSSARLPRATDQLALSTEWTLVSAVNATLRSLLTVDPRILLFGEDIADPKGGVFGFTKGLSSDFVGRVVNSPLAEATIAGVACGLALAGHFPIFELQFVDFVGPAFHQIVNQIATLRWRSAGNWSCPLILYAPCGGYLPAGGPWHSQTNESWFAHAPGLRIVMPSNPQDAAALFRAAAAGEDPVLILLPKHLSRLPVFAAETVELSLGEAVVRREGDAATVVTWGNCVEIALSASDQVLAEQGDRIEVIDLRSLVPCDWETIRNSLAKTGRLVVVQEDCRTCSFGQSVISELHTDPTSWALFGAPPQLVSRGDVHVGFHPLLEAAVLPSVYDVVQALQLVLSY